MKKRSALFKLFRYVKKNAFRIAVCLIMSIASVVLAVVATTVLRTLTNMINDAAIAAVSSELGMSDLLDFRQVSILCFELVGMYGGSIACGFLQSFIMSGVIQRLSYRLRKDISLKIDKLPLEYFDGRTIGDTMSRVTNDVDTVAQSLSSAVSTTVSAVVQIILVAVMMFVTNWQMSIAAVVSVPLSAVVAVVIMRISQKYFKRQQGLLGELNGKAEEAYSGLETVRLYGMDGVFKTDFDKTNAALKKAMYKANTISNITHPLSTFINKLGYVAVCVVGGILVAEGGADLGALAAFLIYVNLFQQPLSSLAQTINVFQQAHAAASRVFEFVEADEQADESFKQMPSDSVDGRVEFRNVRFGYDKNKPIIHNFSAVIEPGQKVAIVGPTGAGKTTLVNLLMRFYDIDDGDILLDGRSIFDMPRESVRSVISMVLQDSWLFGGTLRENIAYTADVTDEQIAGAIAAAGFTHFVNGLPDGLNTVIDVDALSGGQKQLITIARAMVQNSPMMILDEATSNVDTSTEELIQEAMDSLTSGRTSFVIAHRLSTIKNADIILVLKDGDIIEQGNHETLIEQNGFYAQLYNSQFAQA